jgi:hypothetical protein
MVLALQAETGMAHGAVRRVADQLGYGVESVRSWVKQAEVDAGVRPGVTTGESERMRDLETTRFASTNQWDFHLFYTEPDGSGGTIQCLRTVRVEYYQDPRAAAAGVQGIRGIQNSYTGLYLGGIPGH